MNDGLSAADVMALTRDGDCNGMNNMWNNPFIYFVWLALLGGGNGLWGNRGYDVGMQNALTRSDLFEGFNNQDVNSQLRGITNGVCDGFYAVNSSLKDGFYGLQRDLAENRFASQSCCCDTNRNIDAVRYENSRNTCDIVNAIRTDGEATRAMITQNTIQELRDRLEARDRELMSRDFQLSQLSQTASLVNELRPCAKPAYITCSPYTSASFCGSNFGFCGA